MKRPGIPAVLLLALCAGSAVAQTRLLRPGALPVVEAVQAPAWIERGNSRFAVAPGMQIEDRDEIRTGANSRVLLRLPEGSTVKLGENARYRMDEQQAQRRNVYTADMNVFEGAFRFTTDVLTRFRGKREVQVYFANVTAGIRGTDVWGKSTSDRDIVCLIDGRVEVQRGREALVTLDQPLSFYVAPVGQPALPVAPVPPEQLKLWAAETEIQAGRAAPRRGGRWNVILATVSTQDEALKVYDAAQEAGYAVRIRPTDKDGEKGYEIRLTRLASQAEAQLLANEVRGKFAAGEPRISR